MTEKIQATERSTGIEYAIRDIISPARELEKEGVEITKLNIGDPSRFDFDPPEHMKEAYCEAIMDGHNYYCESEGFLELRRAIAEREMKKNNVDVRVDSVQVTTGVSEGLQFVLGTLLGQDEEILVPGPNYPPYEVFCKFYGGVPTVYRTIEEEAWKPDMDDMRSRISEDTRAIVVISPNNPTGALYGKKEIQKIVDLAGEYDVPIISDEIYDVLTYEEDYISPATLAGDVPVIVLSGFSKAYFATGWRLGYLYAVDSEGKLSGIEEAVAKLGRIRLSSNTPGQKAAIAGMKGPMDYLEDYMAKLKERRDFTYKRLNEIENISAQKPEGAFYIFPKIEKGPWEDDKEFVLDFLRNRHVLFVHGSGFGRGGEGHFRSTFLPPIEILEEAFDSLEKFMKKRVG